MIIHNTGKLGRTELSQCVHYLQQYFFDFDMCSVGVVVITSALHAVGHGFETHTEYFLIFSPRYQNAKSRVQLPKASVAKLNIDTHMKSNGFITFPYILLRLSTLQIPPLINHITPKAVEIRKSFQRTTFPSTYNAIITYNN